MVMLFATFVACDSTKTGVTDIVTSEQTEASTFTPAPPISVSTNKPEEQETEEGTEAPDPRLEYSRSREEMEEMFVLTEEDFTKAEKMIKAFEEIGVASDDYEAVDAVYQEFEDHFYYIQTQISIASIIYYLDMNDEEASTAYLDFYELYGDAYNMYIESCKKVYEKSPIRDELFADWTQEEIDELLAYNPETQELREKNEEILVEINALEGADAADKTAKLYAEMVTNYNRLAKLCGYDNYYLYATEKVYRRDYTAESIEKYASYIKKYYIENLEAINEKWYSEYSSLSAPAANIMYYYLFDPFDKQSTNYLQKYIDSLEGSMKDGMNHMFENRNVIFSNSRNSHQSAFQTYLHDLETPFCLFGVNGQSTDSLVHEMGHYYAALYNENTPGYDLAETQSQGNEMLMLDFLKDIMMRSTYNAYKDYTMYTYVAESVICVIIDEFEREVYSLESVEGFESADFDAIMDKICEEYGGKEFINENLTDVNKYWRMVAPNSPVYYISYAVSMTESLNIFYEVSQDRATGREIYRKLCEEIDEESTFLSATQAVGLSSPFEEATFEKIINMIMK